MPKVSQKSSRKKTVSKKKNKRKIVKSYIIKDSVFGQFTISYSDNPWWVDKDKVVKLIQGFKMDCKPAELRILAGISEDQLRYFLEQHQELSRIFEDLRKTPTLKARMTVVRAVGSDHNVAFKYLERKEPDEFKERTEIEHKDQPILIDDIMGDTNDEEE